MKKNKKIIFDFDRTLFNDDAFMRDLMSLLRIHGITDEALLQSYAVLKQAGTLWSPQAWVLRAIGSLPSNIAQSIDSMFLKTHQYVYPDVIPFLQKYAMPKMILSYGDIETQKQKIQYSGIEHFFNSITITNDHHKTSFFDFDTKKEQIIFIDDRAAIVDAVKSAKPDVVCVRIMRSGAAYNHEISYGEDQRIQTLDELIF